MEYSKWPLQTPLKECLSTMGFINPTPIQSRVIPKVLEGRDILATAQTGTGKTGAFGIPLIERALSDDHLSLILAPTRELASQIFSVLQDLCRNTRLSGAYIVGGESFHRQQNAIQRGPSFVVATPGRLVDHLQQGTISLDCVNHFVLDEVDRMLDMGFAPQVKEITKRLPAKRQTLLFSATLPPESQRLSESLLNDPLRIAAPAKPEDKPLIQEQTERVQEDTKVDRLVELLNGGCTGKVLVFARTQSRTDRLATKLGRQKLPATALHGGLTQGQRRRSLQLFASGKCPILVATDIAGRGIDVPGINYVINFDMPANREDYIHRIGRTGRNGVEGTAISLIADQDAWKSRLVFGEPKKPEGASKGRRKKGRKVRFAADKTQKKTKPRRGKRPMRPGGKKRHHASGGQAQK